MLRVFPILLLVALASAASYPAQTRVASCCIRPAVIRDYNGPVEYTPSPLQRGEDGTFYDSPSIEFSTKPICIDGQSAAWRSFVDHRFDPVRSTEEAEDTENGYSCNYYSNYGPVYVTVATRYDCDLLQYCTNDPYSIVMDGEENKRDTNLYYLGDAIYDMYFGSSFEGRLANRNVEGLGLREYGGQLAMTRFPDATCGDIADFCK